MIQVKIPTDLDKIRLSRIRDCMILIKIFLQDFYQDLEALFLHYSCHNSCRILTRLYQAANKIVTYHSSHLTVLCQNNRQDC